MKSLILPLALVIIYILTAILLRDILPSGEEVASNFTRFFAKYGYEIVFIGAFLEGALIIDLLIPGASVVLVGAYFSSIGVLSYPVFLLVSVAGFAAGYFLDFIVGYFGWADILKKIGLAPQLKLASEKLKKWEGKTFLLGYIHPDSATIIAAASGTMKMDIKRFATYNVLATFIWVFIWTGLVYLFGPVVREIFEGSLAYIVIIILVTTAIFGWWGVRRKRRRRNVHTKVHNH